MTTAQTGFFNTPASEPLNTAPAKKRIFTYDNEYFEDPGPQYSPEEVMRLLARTYPALENGSWTSRTLADGTEEITFVKIAGEKGAVSARTLGTALLATPPASLALTLETIHDLSGGPSFSAADLLGELAPRIEAALHQADQFATLSHQMVLRCLDLHPVPQPTLPLGF